LSVATSFCNAENIGADRRTRLLLGVQRWDMYSRKGATQKHELGYLPGKQGFLKDPECQAVTQWLDEIAAALVAWQYPVQTTP